MNKPKELNGGFSSGYKIKNGKNVVLNRNLKNKNKSHFDSDSLNYPNGMVPFIFITLFFLILTICVFAIGFSQFYDLFIDKKVWTNSLICCVTLPFLLNILWLLGRTGFMNSISYGILKFSRNLKLNKFRQKVEFYVTNPAINEVSSINDFNEFAIIRKEKATKWFYISFITYSTIFILGIIIGIAIQYS